MSFLLIALLFQGASVTPLFFGDGERLPVPSTRLVLNFAGFSRADLIEIIPVGRQDSPSIRVQSAAIRNRVLHNEKAYVVSPERRGGALNFTPRDLRQDTILIIHVPAGLSVQALYNGRTIPVRGPLKEAIFLTDLSAESGAPGAILELLNERVRRQEIVLPVIPPVNPSPRLIHSQQPDLSIDEIRLLHRLAASQRPALAFMATVTDTGQVIEVAPLSGIPERLPREILEKLEYAAMRHSYEPYILNGRPAAFRTTIIMEIP